MHVDQLRTSLHAALDDEPAADPVSGRAATDRRVRRHQVRRVATVAAGVLVVLALLASIGRVGRNDELPVVTDPGPEVLHLIPGVAPDGLAIERVFSLPFHQPDTGLYPLASHTFVYAKVGGSVDDADAFAVTISRYDPEVVGARSVTGTVASPSAAPPATTEVLPPANASTYAIDLRDGLRATVVDDGDVFRITVASRTMTDSEREHVARSVVRGGQGLDISHIDLPAGVAAIADSSSLGFLDSSGSVVSIGAQGVMTVFTNDHTRTLTGPSRLLALSLLHGGQPTVDTFRWFLSDERTVQVHGHDAILGRFPSGTSASTVSVSSADGSAPGTTQVHTIEHGAVLMWFESDGNLVVIQTEGLSDDELLRVAEGLRAVDDDEWRQFATTYATTTLPARCTTTGDGGRVCPYSSVGSVVSGTAVAVEAPSPPTTAAGAAPEKP